MVIIKALNDIGEFIALLTNDRAFYQAGGLVKTTIDRMSLLSLPRDGIESFMLRASLEQSP